MLNNFAGSIDFSPRIIMPGIDSILDSNFAYLVVVKISRSDHVRNFITDGKMSSSFDMLCKFAISDPKR